LIVVAVFALLSGFLITSLQSFEPVVVATTAPPSTPTPPPTPSPQPPATFTPAPEEGIWSQVRAARLFDQIAHHVETNRMLSPRTEVPLSFLGEEKMGERLESLYAGDDMDTAFLPYTALGLLPEAPIRVEAQTPAGVYVPEQEQLYVDSARMENDSDAQMLLAHAYVHALQDQHFDLEAMEARAQTTDEWLAIQALIEGDATLATALYSAEELAASEWSELVDLIIRAEHPVYADAWTRSATWARLERFPYDHGREFVGAVLDQGGWDAVDNLYTDPPRSTEQILHPSRYLGGSTLSGEPDPPSIVVVPDLAPALGPDWSLLVRDTLGEFAIGLYLEQAVPEETAWQMADGWDGDRFEVWEQESGRRIVVWRTVWDTSADALAFERGLSLQIPQQHAPVEPTAPPRGLPGRWWHSDWGTIHLRRDGRHVLLIRAPDTNTVVNVVRRLP
jgi:hypothetical protein